MMQFLRLSCAAGLTAMTGCAIVYSYGDYGDAGEGAGGSGPVACERSEECPGEDTPCGTRACEVGVCSINAAPEDTEWPEQTPGDCLRKVCDGRGKVVDKSDDDPRDDGNSCTRDACDNGMPSVEFEPRGTACGEGDATTCDGRGRCRGCQAAHDCPAPGDCFGWKCVAGSCEQVYAEGGRACGDSAACVTDAQSVGNECDGAGVCGPVREECGPYLCRESSCLRACAASEDCASSFQCVNGECLDCDTCGEWLGQVMSDRLPNICDRSRALYDALIAAACVDRCASECGDAVCVASGVPSPACQQCVHGDPAFSACRDDL